jgi:hypothetical protein
MQRFRWEILLGLGLIALSAVFYFVHFIIFKDPHHIFIYLLGDIAFVPVEVLMVTIIIHRLLEKREKQHKLEKLNMVIEVFFSEIGSTLLTYFSDCDSGLKDIRNQLMLTTRSTDREFQKIHTRFKNYDYTIDIHNMNLTHLTEFLTGNRQFLLRLLENPVLLEHESFTDLLRAVFHLTEELRNRKASEHLPDSDLQHLSGDIKRAYSQLVFQWLDYIKYLKRNYPYLFSLAVRLNPFDQNASPVVQE